jgi:hypothetical protein
MVGRRDIVQHPHLMQQRETVQIRKSRPVDDLRGARRPTHGAGWERRPATVRRRSDVDDLTRMRFHCQVSNGEKERGRGLFPSILWRGKYWPPSSPFDLCITSYVKKWPTHVSSSAFGFGFEVRHIKSRKKRISLLPLPEKQRTFTPETQKQNYPACGSARPRPNAKGQSHTANQPRETSKEEARRVCEGPRNRSYFWLLGASW